MSVQLRLSTAAVYQTKKLKQLLLELNQNTCRIATKATLYHFIQNFATRDSVLDTILCACYDEKTDQLYLLPLMC